MVACVIINANVSRETMKYLDFCKTIEEIALTQKWDILFEDVQKLNAEDVDYPAIVVQLKGVDVSAETYDLYSVAITYAERRREVSALSECESYTRGVVCIRALIAKLKDLALRGFTLRGANITPYIYKFRDECIGVVAEMQFSLAQINQCY